MIAHQLAAGLAALDQTLSREAQEKLIRYLELLAHWNKAYNLTAVRDPADMVARHLLDSLAISPYITGDRLLDVGTGAGLPGIPLAIAFPDRQFVLLDSNGKKIRFLTHVLQVLSLPNVTVAEARAEHFTSEACFDGIISRAFAALKDMLLMTAHLCCEGGCFLAMKGVYPQAELDDLPEGFQLITATRLQVPGLEAERHVLCMKRKMD